MRGSPAYKPARVGLASLTYVPDLEGYFREALEVIGVHLASLRQSLNQDCDILVFDNGSCPQVIAFLQEQWRKGVVDWLYLSHHNLGKNGALNWIFSAMPNEFIGYADSDVFFRKGWMENTLTIFDSFEQSGMVSAQPVLFDFLRGEGKTAEAISAAGHQLQVISQKPPQHVVDEYCDGINVSEKLRQQFQQKHLQVAENKKNGARAVTCATDMQFVLRKEVARSLVPMPIAGALTAKDAIEIPRGIEGLGYWVLSTEENYVRHMGNSIIGRNIPEIDAILDQPGAFKHHVGKSYKQTDGLKQNIRVSLQKLIDRSPRIKRALVRVYDVLFSLLYEERA